MTDPRPGGSGLCSEYRGWRGGGARHGSLSAGGAISNINIDIDKIVMWGGAKGNQAGAGVSALVGDQVGALPPALHTMMNIGGVTDAWSRSSRTRRPAGRAFPRGRELTVDVKSSRLVREADVAVSASFFPYRQKQPISIQRRGIIVDIGAIHPSWAFFLIFQQHGVVHPCD